jgi:hypothetical protein
MKTGTTFCAGMSLGALSLVAAFPLRLNADTIDNYTINFTPDPGFTAPTSGAFSYDTTTDSFTAFQVTWYGYTFTFDEFDENAPYTANTGCSGETAGNGAFGFNLIAQTLSGCSSPPLTYEWWSQALPSQYPNQSVFEFYTIDTGIGEDEIYAAITGNTNPGVNAHGTWSITETAPEPGTLVPFVLGIACLFGVRRKCQAPASDQTSRMTR